MFIVCCVVLSTCAVNVYSTGYVVDTINGFVKSLTFFHTYLIFFLLFFFLLSFFFSPFYYFYIFLCILMYIITKDGMII